MSAHPVFNAGHTALITGASCGIGLEITKFCAAQGMSVLLADIKQPPMAELSASYPDTILRYVNCDISSQAGWDQLATSANSDNVFSGGINLLVLNAGTAPGLTAQTNSSQWAEDVMLRTFKTNVFGVGLGISTFMPMLDVAARNEKPTAVVITGSKQGITNPPGNVSYNASKAAVKSMAEQLNFELRKSSTTVHLLVPGWTFTGMTGSSTSSEKPAGAWSPCQVVEYMVKKMTEGQFYIICPDNEIDETIDKKRMIWAMGDVVHGRQPLSRWREDTKDMAAEGIETMEI
ncbi:uncharacterized protein BROUX77_005695 [Berkeleyomyces rouxiae]|uniref:uncharacterized protein n=1 Tax=Berkeleyomyces rouxiae TaxID=2035830 RepID=UPI003B817E23